jgi:hypothetical protein
MSGIPREDLPPDLASVIRPGDHVGVTIVTCWRFPWLTRLDGKHTYYTVYEPRRGDIPLGRFTDGRSRFLSLLGPVSILPVLAWLVGIALLRALFRCAEETPST